MPYQVSLGDQKWRTDDLTLDEAIGIEKATGEGWLQINPFRSADACKAILVAFLSRTMDPAAATAKVGAVSIQEALDGVSVVTDDLPTSYEDGLPKAAGGHSTTGSSGPPADTDGSLT